MLCQPLVRTGTSMGVGEFVVSLIPTIIGPVPERRHCSSVRFARPKSADGKTFRPIPVQREFRTLESVSTDSRRRNDHEWFYIAPQQPIQPQPPLQPVYQEEKGLTVCGIVGVVFGALGFVLSFIPIINNIAAIFGFIGVILAIVALVGTFRGKKRGKALAIVAAVLSVLAIVITLAMQSAASKAIDEATGVSSSQSSAKAPQKISRRAIRIWKAI